MVDFQWFFNRLDCFFLQVVILEFWGGKNKFVFSWLEWTECSCDDFIVPFSLFILQSLMCLNPRTSPKVLWKRQRSCFESLTWSPLIFFVFECICLVCILCIFPQGLFCFSSLHLQQCLHEKQCNQPRICSKPIYKIIGVVGLLDGLPFFLETEKNRKDNQLKVRVQLIQELLSAIVGEASQVGRWLVALWGGLTVNPCGKETGLVCFLCCRHFLFL